MRNNVLRRPNAVSRQLDGQEKQLGDHTNILELRSINRPDECLSKLQRYAAKSGDETLVLLAEQLVNSIHLDQVDGNRLAVVQGSTTADVLEEPPLTAREVECLRWCARGKTCWETAQILEISERTVSFHINSAKEKIGAVNIAHCIAKAVRRSLI